MKKHPIVPAVALTLGFLVLLATWATTACRREATTPASAPTAAGAETSEQARSPSEGPSTGDPSRRALTPAELVATPTTSESSASRALVSLDASDAQMIAEAERAVGGDPPPVFRELVAERRRGATREALEARIRASLGGELRLLRIALDWLDQVLPDPAMPRPSTAPSDHGLGAGGNPRMVQPIEP